MTPLPNITLAHYVDIVLGYKPYRFIKENDDIYLNIMSAPIEERNALVVLENEQWPIGYDNRPLPLLDAGMYRLWNRKDWEICDNKRQQAIVTIEEKQRLYKERQLSMRQAVKDDMLSKGIQPSIWDTLSVMMTDSQLEAMFNNIKH